MISSIQKVIRIGTSGGVTIPAKELKRQNIAFGDEVQVTIQPVNNHRGVEILIKHVNPITSTA